jgi:hypothetical protein
MPRCVPGFEGGVLPAARYVSPNGPVQGARITLPVKTVEEVRLPGRCPDEFESQLTPNPVGPPTPTVVLDPQPEVEFPELALTLSVELAVPVKKNVAPPQLV